MRKSEINQEVERHRELIERWRAIKVLADKATRYEVPDTTCSDKRLVWSLDGTQASQIGCGAVIYYPGGTYFADGDPANKAFWNQVMICPRCEAHILLSRVRPIDMWLLKAGGLSYAEIGRILKLSRQRVQQLCQQYKVTEKAKDEAERKALLEADPNELVKKLEAEEDRLRRSGRLRKRRMDRRTKKKRIIAELNKLRAKEAQNERKHKAKRQG